MRYSQVDHKRTAVTDEYVSRQQPAGKKGKKKGGKNTGAQETSTHSYSSSFYTSPQKSAKAGNLDSNQVHKNREAAVKDCVNARISKVREDPEKYQIFPGKKPRGARGKAAEAFEKLVQKLILPVNVLQNTTDKTIKSQIAEVRNYRIGKAETSQVDGKETVSNPLPEASMTKEALSPASVPTETASEGATEAPEEAAKKAAEKQQAFRNSFDAYVLANLRKGLNRRNAIPVIQRIFFALGNPDSYGEMIGQITNEELKGFLLILNEDYSFYKNSRDTAKSILLKNVKVQVNQQSKLLELSSSGNGSSYTCKKELFPFLCSMSADEATANRKLYELKRLLLSYFYGKNGSWVNDYEEYDPWDFDWITDSQAEAFCEKAEEIMRNPDYVISSQPLMQDSNCVVSGQRPFSDAEKEERRARGRKEDHSAILHKEAEDAINYEIYGRFLRCVKDPEATDSEKYWYGFIKESLDQYFSNRNNFEDDRNCNYALCRKTWAHMIQFLAGKYMDMGKAVFHFAIPAETREWEEGQAPLKFGQILKPYRNGISSFHYEYIHAIESLKKEISVRLAFAINTLNRAAGKGKSSDYLMLHNANGNNALADGTREDAGDRLLRYWGGRSNWEDLSVQERKHLPEELQSVLIYLRNQHYHYNFLGNEQMEGYPVLEKMYRQELSDCGKLFREKMYSNNLPLFYGSHDLEDFMDWLYSGKNQLVIREAGVPAFQRVLKRSELKNILIKTKLLKQEDFPCPEYMEIYLSAIYYALHEIYYRRFSLSGPLVTTYFMTELENEVKLAEQNLEVLDKKKEEFESGKNGDRNYRKNPEYRTCMADYRKAEREKKAIDDFSNRVKELRETYQYGYPAICQDLMAELNLINQKNTGDKEKSGHYRLFLYKCSLQAFLHYLDYSRESVKFLSKPDKPASGSGKTTADLIALKDFLPNWKCTFYDSINLSDEGKNQLRWYAFSHLLDPKQLNELIGVIKDYQAYLRSISKRAGYAGQTWDNCFTDDIPTWNSIIGTLEFCLQYSGRISHEISDYYFEAADSDGTEEEKGNAIRKAYADTLAAFVNYKDPVWEEYGLSGYSQLLAFCKKENGQGGTIGIFADAENPILQRNIERMRMFGCEEMLQHALSGHKIQEADIKDYYRMQKELAPVFAAVKARKSEEQRSLIDYQQMKNKVELHNLTEYSNILHALMGKLVNFAYTRERDQMYFRLGYYYLQMNYGNRLNPDISDEERQARDKLLRSISYTSDFSATGTHGLKMDDGFVLHQIISLETHGMQTFTCDESGNPIAIGLYAGRTDSLKKNGQIRKAGKHTAFMNYFGESGSNQDYGNGIIRILYSQKHAENTQKFRNWMDHFDYFTKQNSPERQYSMMQAWSYAYSDFFCYDRKMKIATTEMLKDTLEHFHIIADLKYVMRGENGKTVRLELRSSDSENTDQKLEAEKFTYKLDDGDLELPAKSSEYLEILEELLNYVNC